MPTETVLCMEPRGQNSPPQPSTPPPHQCPAGTNFSPQQPLPGKCLYEATILLSSARERADPVERMPASALIRIRGRWDKGQSEWTSRVQKGEMERPRQPWGVGYLSWPQPAPPNAFIDLLAHPPLRTSTETLPTPPGRPFQGRKG